MAAQAVVFDIGGVLEWTPGLGIRARWGLPPGEIDRRAQSIWRAGSLGTISETEVNARLADVLDRSAAQVAAFMADIWVDYLGTANQPLIDYFAGLRPRCWTAILSNSFSELPGNGPGCRWGYDRRLVKRRIGW